MTDQSLSSSSRRGLGDAAAGFVPGRFDHEKLDAFVVAREALRQGDAILKGLGRGYATLSDQGRRALLHAYVGIAEAASRQGGDRRARFRTARGEASEAAAVFDAVQMLGLAAASQVQPELMLLARLCAMLTRLSGVPPKRR